MSTRTEESPPSRMQRSIIMGVATGGVANGIDEMMSGATGTDVTGLAGANIGDGSHIHHGPEEGGDILDRPSAGYMAHASATNGITVGPQQGGISEIARSIDKAGTLEIDGHAIDVLDYLPGGDYVQMASGGVDPGQMLMKLAQHGVQHELAAHASPTSGNADGNHIHDGTGVDRVTQGEDDSAVPPGQTEGRTAIGGPGRAPGRHMPDSDENARDLEALSLEHKLDVDTAIQTSDVAQVHTEIHAHGRMLEIDTNFEAVKPDSDEERREAAEHVDDLARGGRDELDHDEPGIHIRSRIAAHLDAASRDEGLAM